MKISQTHKLKHKQRAERFSMETMRMYMMSRKLFIDFRKITLDGSGRHNRGVSMLSTHLKRK